MGGKYEVRYYIKYDSETQKHYETVYTNSWLEFIKLRLTKKVIYCELPTTLKGSGFKSLSSPD